MRAFSAQAAPQTTGITRKLSVSRSVVCRAQQGSESSSSSWASQAAALGAACVMVGAMVGDVQPALAVPQTSACATAVCDGFDLSNQDLRKEFYTKGSLKGANFTNSNLSSVTLFGANLQDADLTGADLSLSNLGQSNLEGANLSQSNLSGAIMSSARFNRKTVIDGADFTDVIIRKDINDSLCKLAKGVNTKTGVDTRESLNCY